MPAVDGDVFPRISNDVLVATTLHGGAAYDKVTETLHHLSAAGTTVLERCDGTLRIDDAVHEWATDAGIDPTGLAATVRDHLAELDTLGLVGRTTRADTRPPRIGSTRTDHGAHTGATHGVLDHGIAFRSDDVALVDRVDTHLGSADPHRRPDVFFDLYPTPDGRVLLVTDDEWDFPSADQLIGQICGVVNEYASRTHTIAALHAAGLRTPTGDVVLLSGPPGAGKTTLAAALVATGWDHLGDETIGLRPATLGAVAYPKPFTLSAASRAALGLAPDHPWPDTAPEEVRSDVIRHHGEVGAVDHVVFVRYTAGTDVAIEPLTEPDRLDAVAAATLNLGGLDDPDFQALCDLADTVPIHRIVHGGVDAAVPAIVDLVG